MSWTRWILATLLACGCEATDEPPSTPAPEVLVGGCVEFGPDTCILEAPSRLSIWLDVPPTTPLVARIDGKPTPSTGRVIHGGVRLQIEVPEGAGVLQIEATDQAWNPSVSQAVEWRGRPPIDELSREQLSTFVKRSSGWTKLRALDRLRRTPGGKVSEVLALGETELALARELGAFRHQAMVLAQRAHTQIEVTHDHHQARETLDGLAVLAEVNPFAALRWHYYNALLARRAGDLGTALGGFEDAQRLSEQLNFGKTNIVSMLANTLAELGRDSEALPLFRHLETELWKSSTPCSQWTDAANNLAWGQLVLASAGREHDDPRPLLLHALERLRSCPRDWTEAALLLDLALVSLQDDRPREALGWLAHIGRVPSDLRGWIEFAWSSAAHESGDPSSRRTVLLSPGHSQDFELSWNRAVHHGDLLAEWGLDDQAVDSYRAAEDQLSATFEQVGTDKGGELYVAGRSASLEGLVEALLRTGRPAEASCAIRLARMREFTRLDRTARLRAANEEERATWGREIAEIARQQRSTDSARARLWELSDADRPQTVVEISDRTDRSRERLDTAVRGLGLHPSPRACSELRTPSEGEVILVAFMSHVFALSDSGIEVSPRADLSSLEILGRASSITLLETESDNPEALHLASWRHAEYLIDLAPVSYSLDLPPRAGADKHTNTALLLADPREDLPEARAEADMVKRTLAAQSWNVVDLRGPDATAASLLEHSANVDLLHYAGHGVRSGLSGWDSALLLADGGRFGIHDVFTLPDVPRGVVLTGCDTAASTPDTVGGGMNIGRAFVLAGSDWVIAADAEVPDRFAAAVGTAVHRTTSQDGPTRLREALLRLRTLDPELPWEQFRVITP